MKIRYINEKLTSNEETSNSVQISPKVVISVIIAFSLGLFGIVSYFLQSAITTTPIPREATISDAKTINVLSVAYYPPIPCPNDPSQTCLDTENSTNVPGFPPLDTKISQLDKYIKTLNDTIINTLEKGSKYKGYANSSAPSYLNYNIIEHKVFQEPIPKGPPQFQPYPDYQNILNKINICNYVDNQNVDQIWLWGYHNEEIGIVPHESNMDMGHNSKHMWNNGDKWDPVTGAKFGDISNDWTQKDDLITCNDTYILFNYSYERSAESALHNQLHQIENILGFTDRQIFWYNFGGKQYLTEPGNWVCGNSHFPPNGIKDYDYQNKTTVATKCDNWHPSGSGQTTQINCNIWGCDEIGYYIWWMQHLPGYQNGITYQGKSMKNWWDAIADFDTFFESEKTFWTTTTAPPTQTPNPTQQPTPVPTNGGGGGGGSKPECTSFEYSEWSACTNGRQSRNITSRTPSGCKIDNIIPLVEIACSGYSTIAFSDIENSKFKDNINSLALDGIVSGYSDGKFKPSEPVTREQMAKFIVLAFKIEINTNGTSFPDVDENSNLAKYIQSLKNAGVVSGYSDGSFRPSTLITREETTKFIVEALNLRGVNTNLPNASITFPDITSYNKYKDYITYLASKQVNGQNIINGYSDGSFKPQITIKREEMAKLIDLSRTI